MIRNYASEVIETPNHKPKRKRWVWIWVGCEDCFLRGGAIVSDRKTCPVCGSKNIYLTYPHLKEFYMEATPNNCTTCRFGELWKNNRMGLSCYRSDANGRRRPKRPQREKYDPYFKTCENHEPMEVQE